MLALALILLALVIVMVVASFTGGTDEVIIEFANVTITTSVGGVFVAGVLAGVVALLSLVALRISIQRIRHRRREVEELRRRADQAAPPPAEPTPTASAEDTVGEPDTAELPGDRPITQPAGEKPTRPSDPPRTVDRDVPRDDERR